MKSELYFFFNYSEHIFTPICNRWGIWAEEHGVFFSFKNCHFIPIISSTVFINRLENKVIGMVIVGLFYSDRQNQINKIQLIQINVWIFLTLMCFIVFEAFSLCPNMIVVCEFLQLSTEIYHTFYLFIFFILFYLILRIKI